MFVASSGRQYDNEVNLFKPVKDQISYIAENGSICIHKGNVIFRTVIAPELIRRIIDEVKKVNPDILIFYHSCGLIEPLIPQLIEAGIDVLNPIQCECMDFEEIHKEYGSQVSFHGTIGTQTVMPHGTPEEVKQAVWENLDTAGEKGGLFVAPTHMVEPEVPLENILAYVEACRTYRKA